MLKKEGIQSDADIIAENEQLKQEIIFLKRDIERVTTHLDWLLYHLKMIESSHAWQIGFKVTCLIRKILHKPQGENIFYHINKRIDSINHWKRSYDK